MQRDYNMLITTNVLTKWNSRTKKYYEDLGVPVPLGQPGTNPGQLAKSEKLKYIGKLEV